MSLLYPQDTPLFSGFRNAKKSDWLKQVSLDLTSKNFEELLLGKLVDGVKVYPFYTKEDVDQYFINYRQFSDKAYTHESWEFQEQIQLTEHFSEADANTLALQVLAQGSEALLFDCTMLSKVIDFSQLLQSIIPEGTTISWKLPSYWKADQCTSFFHFCGVVHLNPLENFLIQGKDYHQGLNLISSLLQQNHPNLKKLSVSGQQFVNSGASVIQEIGLTCSLLVAYLDELTEIGHEAEKLFSNIEISLATRSAYFIDIAKYRALQLLLHQLADTYGVGYKAQFPIRAVSSVYNKSAYDLHMNVLRNTSEAMAAVIGGCKTISISPHTGRIAPENTFARRISRNVSHILRHEAHLDLVQDAVAGSYALENLTQQIARQAWAYFLEIEKEGGILHAFKKGKVQKDIAQQASSFLDQVGSMKKVLVGSNRYVDQSLKSPDNEPLSNPDHDGQNLVDINGPAVIESVRYRVEQAVAKGKTRPCVGLVSINGKAKSSVLNARLSFVEDVLGSIGIHSKRLGGPFLSLDHPAKVLAGIDALVLLSDDEQYATLSAEDIKAVIHSYTFPVLLAGYPEQIVNRQDEYGFYSFLHKHMHVPDFANKFLKDIKFSTNEA